ncbi:MAG: hypothetical protein WCX79_01155 [Candidatus Paceibacterota bacterium]|jgi:hypothetical protein
MTLSVKSRLEARIKYRHHMPFSKLINIIKSIDWYTTYIQNKNSVTLVNYLNPQKYPKEIVVIKITEKDNQIWNWVKGNITATIVEIEEF